MLIKMLIHLLLISKMPINKLECLEVTQIWIDQTIWLWFLRLYKGRCPKKLGKKLRHLPLYINIIVKSFGWNSQFLRCFLNNIRKTLKGTRASTSLSDKCLQCFHFLDAFSYEGRIWLNHTKIIPVMRFGRLHGRYGSYALGSGINWNLMENRKKEKITLMSMCIKNENEFDDKTCQNLAKLSCKFLLTAKYCSLGRLQEIK